MPIRLRYRWTANENEPCHYIIMCVLCEFEYVITFFGCLFRYCTVVKNCECARRITRNSIRTMHKRFVIGLGLVPIVFSSLLGSFFHSISAVLCVSCRFTFNFNGIAVWAVELSLSNTIIRLKYTHTQTQNELTGRKKVELQQKRQRKIRKQLAFHYSSQLKSQNKP